jgi:hypothetical protein
MRSNWVGSNNESSRRHARGSRNSLRRRVRVIQRAPRYLWAFVDQGCVTLSNLIIVAGVGRLGGQRELGMMALAIAVYSVALGIGRVLVGEPLLLARTAAIDEYACSVHIAVAAGIGLLCVPAILAAGGALHCAAAALVAPAIPFLLAQDAARFVLFQRNHLRAATIVDASWVVVSIALFPVLVVSRTAATGVIVWAIGGVASCATGIWLAKWRPITTSRAWSSWRVTTWPLASWISADGVAYNLGIYLPTVVIFSVAGSATAGSIKAAQLVANPALLLLASMNIVVVPMLAKSPDLATARIAKLSLRLGGVVAVTATSLVVLAPQLSALLFSGNSNANRLLVALFALQAIATAGATPVGAALRLSNVAVRQAVARAVAVTVGCTAVTVAALSRDVTAIAAAVAGQGVLYFALAWAALLWTKTDQRAVAPKPVALGA